MCLYFDRTSLIWLKCSAVVAPIEVGIETTEFRKQNEYIFVSETLNIWLQPEHILLESVHILNMKWTVSQNTA